MKLPSIVSLRDHIYKVACEFQLRVSVMMLSV